QWNCACPNCQLVRRGKFPGKVRSQAQVAVSEDGKSWFLLGASPDLRSQIEATPELQPRDGTNNSPLSGVVLASADLDHVLGLMLTSDSGRKMVYAPAVASITQSLREWLEKADLLLFDGTFYSDDELTTVRGSGELAREMGHIPVGGEDGSLRQLAGLRIPRK